MHILTRLANDDGIHASDIAAVLSECSNALLHCTYTLAPHQYGVSELCRNFAPDPSG